ncbi:hypothetical protein [Micromonospora sp. WMMD998]|nr:hypothetical protein [Micromonospora sp. WMMD998]WFE40374.1 hypothetical protein O7619_18795 [Micromonospora sp. WMMD998]
MNERTGGGQQVRLVVSWLLVAVLLGYGVIQTLLTAVKLFAG